MAVPTVPTKSNIVSEALQKAGYGASPPSALTTRAEDYWMEEIKHDIWSLSTQKLKTLETEHIHAITHIKTRYSNPADFSKGISMVLLDGDVGVAQAGTTASITLSATEATAIIAGKEIFIYEGTGINQISQCTAYNSTTKVAMIDTVTTAPDNTSKYMIISNSYPLDWLPLWHYDSIASSDTKGTPLKFASEQDEDYDEFFIYPSPYRSGDIPWGLRQRYYANLLTLDLTGTLMITLYREWRGVFIQGVLFKALQNMDDDRQEGEKKLYFEIVNSLIARESISV